MEEQNANPTRRDPFWNVALTGLLVFGLARWWYFVLMTGPRFTKMFQEMDLGELPLTTDVLLRVSSLARSLWFISLPAGIVGLLVPAWLIPPKWAKWACLVVVFVGLALNEFCVKALFDPMVTMMDRLSEPPGGN